MVGLGLACVGVIGFVYVRRRTAVPTIPFIVTLVEAIIVELEMQFIHHVLLSLSTDNPVLLYSPFREMLKSC